MVIVKVPPGGEMFRYKRCEFCGGLTKHKFNYDGYGVKDGKILVSFMSVCQKCGLATGNKEDIHFWNYLCEAEQPKLDLN